MGSNHYCKCQKLECYLITLSENVGFGKWTRTTICGVRIRRPTFRPFRNIVIVKGVGLTFRFQNFSINYAYVPNCSEMPMKFLDLFKTMFGGKCRNLTHRQCSTQCTSA